MGERRPGLGARAALLAAAVLTVLLSGCAGGDGDTRSAAAPDLAGASFVSTDVQGRRLVDGTQVRLAFGEDTVSAVAGCNTLFGGAQWSSGALELDGGLARTMMACDDPLMQEDDWLDGVLASGPELTQEGDTLTLVSGDVRITLEPAS